MKSWVAGVALATLFSASAQASLWSPDFVLKDETNRVLPVSVLDGLTYRQCVDFLRLGARKVQGFSGSCSSQTQQDEAAALCLPDERAERDRCYLIGSGPKPPE